jgi:cephalosporin-C deacetylase-like acetyl esterase
MSRQDISFKTGDGVTLRGWFYTPSDSKATHYPCLVMSHGFSCLKEMDLDLFASYFSSHLPLSCLVYDHRGFGSSDTAPGQPRREIIPALQRSDIQDAITYAQLREDVDEEKIGLWGSSYSGGHAIQVAASDRRVKAVLIQNPFVSGLAQIMKDPRPEMIAALTAACQAGE